jgi:hypothetical protein
MKTPLKMEMYYVREYTPTCRFLKIINSTLKLYIGTPYRGKRFFNRQISTSCLPKSRVIISEHLVSNVWQLKTYFSIIYCKNLNIKVVYCIPSSSLSLQSHLWLFPFFWYVAHKDLKKPCYESGSLKYKTDLLDYYTLPLSICRYGTNILFP